MPIPGISYPTTITGTGTQARNGEFEGHIFSVGLEKPDVSSALIIKYPNYYLTSLTDKISGGSREIFTNTHSWFVQDRTRKSASITSVANGTTATATLTLDTTYDAASGNLGYFLVGDTIRVAESGIIGRVTAVGNSGGTVQTVDVVRYDGANWATSTVLATWHIGHVGTSFGDGSASSGGYRTYTPTEDYNVTSILRRGFKISRDVMKQKTWIDDKSWYFKAEDFEQREFMRDIEATLLFGKRYKSSSIQGNNQSRGLMEYAETSGKTVTFSSSIGVQESDLGYMLQQLLVEQGSSDLIVLCGAKFLFDIQHALGNRYREIPQTEKPREIAGLNFQSYEIAGRRLHFAYYELFNDTSILPSVSASSTVKDFNNLGLVLDFGTTDGGDRNIQMLYRDGAKMIQKFLPGMGADGLQIASTFDGVQGELLSEFMPVCRLANRLGILYSNS